MAYINTVDVRTSTRFANQELFMCFQLLSNISLRQVVLEEGRKKDRWILLDHLKSLFILHARHQTTFADTIRHWLESQYIHLVHDWRSPQSTTFYCHNHSHIFLILRLTSWFNSFPIKLANPVQLRSHIGLDIGTYFFGSGNNNSVCKLKSTAWCTPSHVRWSIVSDNLAITGSQIRPWIGVRSC